MPRVVMGLIDPDYFLGGTIPLDGDAATTAIDGRLAGPLGFSVDEAAAGIYRLTTVQMANAIRALTVNRGHDPREFTMVSFGGACGLFAAEIARECDVAPGRHPRRRVGVLGLRAAARRLPVHGRADDAVDVRPDG